MFVCSAKSKLKVVKLVKSCQVRKYFGHKSANNSVHSVVSKLKPCICLILVRLWRLTSRNHYKLIPQDTVNGRTRLWTQDAENSTHPMSHNSPQHQASFIKMEAAGKNFFLPDANFNFNCHFLTDDVSNWHDWFARHDWNEMKMLVFHFFFLMAVDFSSFHSERKWLWNGAPFYAVCGG